MILDLNNLNVLDIDTYPYKLQYYIKNINGFKPINIDINLLKFLSINKEYLQLLNNKITEKEILYTKCISLSYFNHKIWINSENNIIKINHSNWYFEKINPTLIQSNYFILLTINISNNNIFNTLYSKYFNLENNTRFFKKQLNKLIRFINILYFNIDINNIMKKITLSKIL